MILFILTFFSSQKYSLLLSRLLSFFFLLSVLFVGVFRNSRISFCPFDALFLHPLSTAKASDDARRTLDHNKAFLLLDASVFTSVPPRSRALSREREREKEITPFILTHRPFLRLERKSPRVSRVFFNPHRLFLPQKKEKIITERAKILARTKTLLRAFREQKRTKKCSTREREILFLLASSSRLEEAFY